jgi:hypothetical protein
LILIPEEIAMTWKEIAESINKLSEEERNKEALFWSSTDGEFSVVVNLVKAEEIFQDTIQWVEEHRGKITMTDFDVEELNNY